MGEWDELRGQLAARRAAGERMGGETRLGRLAHAGRLNVRARVAALVDAGTFTELGSLAGLGEDAPADAFVAGSGLIDGRPVLIGAEDGTVLGGSIGLAGNAKRTRLAHLALQERLPLIFLLDGAGHRATNALTRRAPTPNDLPALADLSGIVPVIVGVLGASAGHGALAAPLADIVVMVDGSSQLFTAGPPIVKGSTGEEIDKESLGGWAVAGPAGVAHLAAPTDADALAMIRTLFRYLPRSAWEYPPNGVGDASESGGEPPGLGPCELERLIPVDLRRPYDMRPVIAEIFDDDSMIELSAPFGTSIITALAFLDGEPVAVVANQPLVRAGAIDRDAAEKAARFIEMAGSFHLPLVLLADNPGVLPGSAAERSGILRAAARMYVAQHRHPGPKLHLTIRKAFGFGSSIMGQNPFDGQVVRLALPTATVGAMPASGAASASKADAATTEALLDHEAGGPWRLADSLGYDEVIAPCEVRHRLVTGLRLALDGRRAESAAPVARVGHLP